MGSAVGTLLQAAPQITTWHGTMTRVYCRALTVNMYFATCRKNDKQHIRTYLIIMCRLCMTISYLYIFHSIVFHCLGSVGYVAVPHDADGT